MNNAALDNTLIALAHPTRRAILERLSLGEARVTTIAAPFDLSLNTISKRVRMLERARLVQRRREGREHVLSYNRQPLDDAAVWMESHRARWESAFDRFAKVRGGVTMAEQPSATVVIERTFKAPIEKVWAMWTTRRRGWRMVVAEPMVAKVLRLDLRVGGGYEIESPGLPLPPAEPTRRSSRSSVSGVAQ